MTVYYARPMTIHGTKQEERDINLLESIGFKVANPNKEALVEKYEPEEVEAFLESIRGSDLLAFRSFPDGSIGAGVHNEIHEALAFGKPVIELPTILSKRVLSAEDTKAYFRLNGSR